MTSAAFGSAITIVALGVADLAAARAFYKALGFIEADGSGDNIVFLRTAGTMLSLYPRHLLAEDACVADDGAGFDGVTLARNFSSEAEVDAAMAHAIACGGRQTKAPQKVFWGGYSGYFADPDGHLWELAYNPYLPLDANGLPRHD
jgi:predicted lactoylglutathione lyase